MALLLPVSCVIAVILFTVAIPVSIIAMMIMLVKPGVVRSIQETAQRKMTKAIMGHMIGRMARA
jgi:hypothetical protein